MIDSFEIPSGWGFTPPRVRERMHAEMLRREPDPVRRRLMDVAHLREQGCSWVEVYRLTGMLRCNYLRACRLRNGREVAAA